MGEVICASFSPKFRSELVNQIKSQGGPNYNLKKMIEAGFHPSFAKAIVRSIIKREGW